MSRLKFTNETENSNIRYRAQFDVNKPDHISTLRVTSHVFAV